MRPRSRNEDCVAHGSRDTPTRGASGNILKRAFSAVAQFSTITRLRDASEGHSSSTMDPRRSLRKRTASSGVSANGEASSSSTEQQSTSSPTSLYKRLRRRSTVDQSETRNAHGNSDAVAVSQSRKGKQRDTSQHGEVPSTSEHAISEDSPPASVPDVAQQAEQANVGAAQVPVAATESTAFEAANSDPVAIDHRTQLNDRVRRLLANAGDLQASVNTDQTGGGDNGASNDASPTMLSVLLSDVLGLRGSRSASGEQAQSATTASSSARNINGGTSVIVQGALVARTVTHEERERQRQSAASMQPPTAQTEATSPEQEGATATSRGSTTASSRTSNLLPEENVTHSATIEEQTRMLIRLLSIATAATAASLASSDPTQTPVPADVSSRDPTLAIAPEAAQAVAQGVFDRLNGQTSVPTFPVRALPEERRRRATWLHSLRPSLRGVRSGITALRSRLPSFGSQQRTRGELQSDPLSQVHAEEPSTQGGAGTGSDDATTPIAATASGDGVTSDHASAPTDGRASPASLTATLSSMLRDAIRDGMSSPARSSNAPGQGANQPVPPRSLDATLASVREGVLVPGEPGSFERFLFDLANDLGAAVRRLPTRTSTEASLSEALEVDGLNLDTARAERRQRDTHGGQLSFFRYFTFPPNMSPNSDSTTNNALLPCVLVGVRSLGETAPTRAAAVPPTPAAREAPATRPRRASDPVMPSRASQVPPTNANNIADEATDTVTGHPLSRFLLFISGGHYSPQHPLFRVSNAEASRDLMLLMEVMGALASLSQKQTTTVTQDQIANSNLRHVNGSRREIETLMHLKQVMENTSERCLICLEEWLDEVGEGENDKASADVESRRLLDCGHLFHAPCLDQWLTKSNNSCPLCRRQAVTVNGAPAPAPMPPVAAEPEVAADADTTATPSMP